MKLYQGVGVAGVGRPLVEGFGAPGLPKRSGWATLLGVLDTLVPAEEKQSTVVLGDLAAVEAAAGDPEAACRYAVRALDQLERTWYAMGMDRVREVRRSLAPHQHEPCVRELDDRLYGWSTTVSALAR